MYNVPMPLLHRAAETDSSFVVRLNFRYHKCSK